MIDPKGPTKPACPQDHQAATALAFVKTSGGQVDKEAKKQLSWELKQISKWNNLSFYLHTHISQIIPTAVRAAKYLFLTLRGTNDDKNSAVPLE